MAMKKRENVYLKKLQELTEAELQETVIVPLFQGPLQYDSVDQYGGPDEHGIDLICWKRDVLGNQEVAAVQIKRFKPARSSSSENSFAGLLTQVAQATEKKIPHNNGNKYFPRTFYFVTPYPLDTRTLETRFAKVSALKQHGLKIIEGEKLLDLIKKYLPSIAQQIFDVPPDIPKATADLLNNKILLGALKSPSNHHIESFYTDIDFSVGNVNARLFLLANLKLQETKVDLEENEWSEFKWLSSQCKATFGVALSTQDFATIELGRKKSKEMKEWNLKEVQANDMQKNLVKLERQHKKLEESLRELSNNFRNISPEDPLPRDIEKYIPGMNARIPIEDIANYISTEEYSKGCEAVKGDIIYIEDALKPQGTNIIELFQKLDKTVKGRISLFCMLKDFAKNSPPLYSVTINTRKLINVIKIRRKGILKSLENFRQKEQPLVNLKTFLQNVQPDIECASMLFSKHYVQESILDIESTNHITDTESCRLSISVHKIFDCNMNTIVLGEAGAGKTTSLQMYANLLRGNPDKVPCYMPLTRLVSSIINEDIYSKLSPDKRLLQYLVTYLSSKGCHVTLDKMISLCQEGKIVLMLDGIDEVITSDIWLVESIQSFSKKYPATQLITSCRTSSYHANIFPFVTVTLLPFSKTQRNKFIGGWFKGHKDGKTAKKVLINHLEKNQELANVVKNPFHATLMCTLHENSVPLPQNEIRLYDSRLELLLGYYDIHKQAKRIKSYTADLYTVAECIAYSLHVRSKREASLEEIHSFVDGISGNHADKVKYRYAVNELISPCEILVQMTDVGKLGLGHKRHQEHLSARYLHVHMNTEIANLAQESSWYDVLMLLARMRNDVDWFVHHLAYEGCGLSNKVLNSIISMHSPLEQQRLKKIAKKGAEFRRLDEVYIEDDVHYNSSGFNS